MKEDNLLTPVVDSDASLLECKKIIKEQESEIDFLKEKIDELHELIARMKRYANAAGG